MTDRLPPLFILLAIAAYGAAIVLAGGVPAAVHLIVGLPLALFLPGWTLLRTLRIGDGGVLDGALLAVGISIVEVVLLGLALHFVPLLSLEPDPWRLGLTLLVLVQGAAALLAAPATDETGPAEAATPRLVPVLASLLPLAIVAVAGVVSVRSAGRADAAAFTQLWALPLPGPEVALGVRNHEGGPVTYHLDVAAPDGAPVLGYQVSLNEGGTWRRVVPLPPSLEDRPAQVRLYREGEAEPYRRVDLPTDPAAGDDAPDPARDEAGVAGAAATGAARGDDPAGAGAAE